MTMKYTWIAYYKDGTSLSQYDSEGKEHLFNEIVEDNLEEFKIKSESKSFEINLQTGSLTLNGTPVLINHVKDGLKRLIYFRRTKASTDGAYTIKHCIGVQTTTEGINKKIMLFVDNDTDELELTME